MTAWGPDFRSSDIALGACIEYEKSLKIGLSDEEAYNNAYQKVAKYIDCEAEYIDFWLGMADEMLKYGRLSEEVKHKALDILAKDDVRWSDKKRWTKKQIEKRELKISDLKNRLLGPLPPRKEVRVIKPYICPFKPGDVFLHKINDMQYCDRHYFDWFYYILVDDVVSFDTRFEGLGDMYPRVYIKYSQNEILNLTDIEKLGFIRTGSVFSQEHRIQLYDDGFKKFFKTCKYIGNYDFARIDKEKSINVDNEKGTEVVTAGPEFIMHPPHAVDTLINNYLEWMSYAESGLYADKIPPKVKSVIDNNRMAFLDLCNQDFIH